MDRMLWWETSFVRCCDANFNTSSARSPFSLRSHEFLQILFQDKYKNSVNRIYSKRPKTHLSLLEHVIYFLSLVSTTSYNSTISCLSPPTLPLSVLPPPPCYLSTNLIQTAKCSLCRRECTYPDAMQASQISIRNKCSNLQRHLLNSTKTCAFSQVWLEHCAWGHHCHWKTATALGDLAEVPHGGFRQRSMEKCSSVFSQAPTSIKYTQ